MEIPIVVQSCEILFACTACKKVSLAGGAGECIPIHPVSATVHRESADNYNLTY
jgi:hypothetical protein